MSRFHDLCASTYVYKMKVGSFAENLKAETLASLHLHLRQSQVVRNLPAQRAKLTQMHNIIDICGLFGAFPETFYNPLFEELSFIIFNILTKDQFEDGAGGGCRLGFTVRSILRLPKAKLDGLEKMEIVCQRLLSHRSKKKVRTESCKMYALLLINKIQEIANNHV